MAAAVIATLNKRRRLKVEKKKKKADEERGAALFCIYDRDKDDILNHHELTALLLRLDSAFFATRESLDWLSDYEPVTVDRIIYVVKRFRMLMSQQRKLVTLIDKEVVEGYVPRTKISSIMHCFAQSLGARIDQTDDDFIQGILSDFFDNEQNTTFKTTVVSRVHLLIALIHWYQCLHDNLRRLAQYHNDGSSDTSSSCSDEEEEDGIIIHETEEKNDNSNKEDQQQINKNDVAADDTPDGTLCIVS